MMSPEILLRHRLNDPFCPTASGRAYTYDKSQWPSGSDVQWHPMFLNVDHNIMIKVHHYMQFK